MVGEVVPTKANHLVVITSQTRADNGVLVDVATKQVADEGFDGVGFVEDHVLVAANLKVLFRNERFNLEH